jgi:hypothetical protein
VALYQPVMVKGYRSEGKQLKAPSILYSPDNSAIYRMAILRSRGQSAAGGSRTIALRMRALHDLTPIIIMNKKIIHGV